MSRAPYAPSRALPRRLTRSRGLFCASRRSRDRRVPRLVSAKAASREPRGEPASSRRHRRHLLEQSGAPPDCSLSSPHSPPLATTSPRHRYEAHNDVVTIVLAELSCRRRADIVAQSGRRRAKVGVSCKVHACDLSFEGIFQRILKLCKYI